jgi:hypothetical protein
MVNNNPVDQCTKTGRSGNDEVFNCNGRAANPQNQPTYTAVCDAVAGTNDNCKPARTEHPYYVSPTGPPNQYFKLTVKAQFDTTGTSIGNVVVTVDPQTSDSQTHTINWPSGETYFLITSGPHTITFIAPLPYSFSHFWDNNCSNSYYNYYQDTTVNPYSFWMYVDRKRTITAFYKVPTQITNTAGSPNTFEYNGTYVKGRLLNEKNNALIKGPKTSHDVCEDSNIKRDNIDVDKNVVLEYYDGLNWNYIGTAQADDDGNWLYQWYSVAGTKGLRATYTPTNWFYKETSAEMCPGDINGDGKTGLPDLVLLANAYSSKPGDSKWNPNADLNDDGKVSLPDLVIMAKSYGCNPATA